MKIIEPSVELWKQNDVIEHVARCARICYRKETGNDDKLYTSLLNRKHCSMFRHATYYFIIPHKYIPKWLNDYFNAICFGAKIIGIDIDFVRGTYYIVTNGNWNLDHQGLLTDINDYMVSAKEFANANEVTWNMMRYTFKVTTQISTSRELNRVSPNNISEQSTRYVYEDGTICRPHWFTKEEADLYNEGKSNLLDEGIKYYLNSCACGFNDYKHLVEFYKLHRQDARGVLPIDTATVCAYTYSYTEWLEILKKRLYHTTGKAHPNCVIICKMIEDKLKELGYDCKF